MRNFEVPGRSHVVSTNGMAATSHPMSTLVAINVLQGGGNAMDAAVAACAVQCVVEPGSTGIGGDCFALYAPGGTDAIVAFNGSGRAPAAATPERYLAALGANKIPRQSPHAVTMPGAVDAWSQLVRDHGTKTLGELLQPAIKLARDGYAVAERASLDWREMAGILRADPGASRIFLPGGASPASGTVHRQIELAQTLGKIAENGPDAFYQGEVAEDIVGYLQSLGGFHTLDDFKATRGDYVVPVKSGFRGFDLFECPPSGQGIIAQMILNILAGFQPDGDPMSLNRVIIETEATRLAYSVRDAFLADPSLAPVPVKWLLSESLSRDLRDQIRTDRIIDPLPSHAPAAHEDTVYISVVDKERNAASFINSIFTPFGSGLVAPRSGVLLHNRATSFSLESGHPNAIAPGKRPMHTIIPAMLAREGRVVMPFGVMGGHYQAMGQAYFLSKVLDYGLEMQTAMELPRFFPIPGTKQIELESTFPSDVVAGLRHLGFDIVKPARPIGGSQAIWINWDNGVLTGASDSRKDGCALGY